MPRYIDADKYKADLLVGQEYLDEDTFLTAINLLDCQSTTDVVEVKHGQWIKPTKINGRNFAICHCSVCEGVPCGIDENTRYCPNCGARMDGKEE